MPLVLWSGDNKENTEHMLEVYSKSNPTTRMQERIVGNWYDSPTVPPVPETIKLVSTLDSVSNTWLPWLPWLPVAAGSNTQPAPRTQPAPPRIFKTVKVVEDA